LFFATMGYPPPYPATWRQAGAMVLHDEARCLPQAQLYVSTAAARRRGRRVELDGVLASAHSNRPTIELASSERCNYCHYIKRSDPRWC
jgi:hypothetical protein